MGNYVIEETNRSKTWYYMIMGEGGIYCSMNGRGNASGGYEDRSGAETAMRNAG